MEHTSNEGICEPVRVYVFSASNIVSESMGSFKQMSVCRGCLASDRRMISTTRYEVMYKDLTGLIVKLQCWYSRRTYTVSEQITTDEQRLPRTIHTQQLPFTCCSLLISPSDGLPQWLCYECSALLEKYIILRNKMIKSHYTLYQYVTQSVPFAYEENKSSHLTQTSITHYKIPGIKTEPEQLEEQIKLEIAEVKAENVYDDNITIEEWHFEDHLNELTNNSSTLELKHEKQTEQGQASPPESHVGSEAARPSLRARLHFEEHSSARVPEKPALATHTRDAEDITSTPFSEDCRDSVKGIVDSDVRDSSSSCNNIQSYICYKCNKVFYDKILLITHIREHPVTGYKPYKCDLCKKGFTQKTHLNLHNRIHTGNETYKCNICMKSFTRKSHLDKHYRKHTAVVKPHKCDFCMKYFRFKSSLDTHYRVHTGDKPYKCEVCMKCFRTNSVLNNHYRIHTGDKPFKCDVCKKCFTHKHSLNVHYRKHTNDKPQNIE